VTLLLVALLLVLFLVLTAILISARKSAVRGREYLRRHPNEPIFQPYWCRGQNWAERIARQTIMETEARREKSEEAARRRRGGES